MKKQTVKWRIDRISSQATELGTHLYSAKRVAEKNKRHLEAANKEYEYELVKVVLNQDE